MTTKTPRVSAVTSARTRTVEILLLLMQGQTTYPALRERFDVHPNTLMYDLDAIEAAGIPLHRGTVYLRLQPEATQKLSLSPPCLRYLATLPPDLVALKAKQGQA
tara:strand:- start:1726 stop:2040 length:315 start_codon:yes stop_codon:yes gene_type:complete